MTLIKQQQFIYLTILPIGIAILFLPNFSSANSFSQAPVPTFEVVNSLADTTEVTVPENLKKEWKGKFTSPVNLMVTMQSWKLKDLIEAKYLFQKELKPETRTFSYNPARVYAWTKTVAQTVNTPSQDPELTIKDGRATHFVPPVIGKQLDRYQSTLKILRSLELGDSNIELSVKTTQPSKKLSQLNDQGIIELIGRGESKFNGSPANRRHNIKIGVQKMKGVIVEPGEEFSFNKYLGPVEADQGFLPELVIKKDKGTVPELGGGLCQVSSTTFRAIMHAGLPITQRRNHSYAVQYYAPQGTDATIYPGVIDLKFINDTGQSILIWPYFKTNDYLVFDFYGTYDGRQVKLNQPSTYDRKADGSMKATWTRTVTTKDGEIKSDRFASVYQSPALFHKKEEFVTAPTTPPAEVPPEQPKPNSETEGTQADKPQTQNNIE